MRESLYSATISMCQNASESASGYGVLCEYACLRLDVLFPGQECGMGQWGIA